MSFVNVKQLKLCILCWMDYRQTYKLQRMLRAEHTPSLHQVAIYGRGQGRLLHVQHAFRVVCQVGDRVCIRQQAPDFLQACLHVSSEHEGLSGEQLPQICIGQSLPACTSAFC